MPAHAGNVLAYVGRLIGGGFWSDVMIVAVLGGTLASLQAAIVSASRIGYAMGRDRVFPAWFGSIHARHQTPWNATIAFGLLNVVFLWAATLSARRHGTVRHRPRSALWRRCSTCSRRAAAVWYYRKSITSSASNLVLGGLLPGLGAAFMAFVIIYSLASGALNGIQIGFGFGFAVIGLILSFVVARTRHPRFYTDPRSSHGDHIEEELAAPESGE